jgi:hypothetical protein
MFDRRLFALGSASLTLMCTSCNKAPNTQQSPVQQNVVRPVPAASTAAAQPAFAIAHFSGEVRRRQRFEKSIAANMIFRLEDSNRAGDGRSIGSDGLHRCD